MMDAFAGLFGLLNTFFNADVLIVLAVVGGLGLVGRAYFRSKAADGRLTVEDWLAIAVVSMLGVALFYGVWVGMR